MNPDRGAVAVLDVSIPTVNRPHLLRRALDSALSQSLGGVAVTVVDNGSAAATTAVLRELRDPRLEVVRHAETIQRNANYNVALAAGASPYVAILADDDEWLPDFAGRAIAPLETDPGVVVVHTGYEKIDGENRLLSTVASPAPNGELVVEGRAYVEWMLAGSHRFEFTGTVLRRSALPAGGFHPEDDGTDDLGLLLRTALRGRVAVVPEPLVRIRIHAGTVSAAVSTGPVAGRYRLSVEYRERCRAAKHRFIAEQEEALPARTRRRMRRLADRSLRRQLLVPAARTLRTTGSARQAWRRAVADLAVDRRALADAGAWKRAAAAMLDPDR